MKTFTLRINEIRPSQLYISEVKLKKVRTWLEEVDHRALDPIPIKRIGNTTFFTDGHTRAFALMEKGIEDIQVYWDPDDLDWLQYLICVAWCEDAGIKEIAHLGDRVVDHSTYRRLWHKRCDAMQKGVQQGDYPSITTQQIMDPAEKSLITESILRALPDWFGIEEALQDYVRGVADIDFLAIQVGNRSVGFVSVLHHNEFSSEVYCMGIYKEVHSRGLGRLLMQAVEALLSNMGKKFLTVKTLGDSFPDEGYERTKQFYRSVGFFPLEESRAIWGPETPCLVMVKALD